LYKNQKNRSTNAAVFLFYSLFKTIFWQKINNEVRNTIFSKNVISKIWLKFKVSI